MAQLRSPSGAPRVLALWPLLLLLPIAMAARIMPGGLMPRPVTDPGVQEAVRFCVDAYNKASNGLYYSRALRVLSAQSQVVEGVKYYVTVELVDTRCEKKGGVRLNHVALERCALPPAAEQQKRICEFQVWSRPWLNDTRLLSMDCKPS